MAAVHHLGFVGRVMGPGPTAMTTLWSLSLCKIWLESVAVLGWGLWAILPPNGEQYQQNRQKAHPCASPRLLSHETYLSMGLTFRDVY